MIKERYCSYEVARLLKEKGFDWECIGYYVDGEPNDIKHSFLGETNSDWKSRCCSAPTHQMACDWLREMYNIHIEINFYRYSGAYRYIIKYSTAPLDDIYSLELYSKYEDAVNAALECSLILR